VARSHDAGRRGERNRPRTSSQHPYDRENNHPQDLSPLRRRAQRQARKDRTKDVHLQRMARLRDQRQAEPSSPVPVIVAIVLLAIIVFGFGFGLPRLFGGDDKGAAPLRLLTPEAPLEVPTSGQTHQTDPSGSSSLPSSDISAPPVVTERPSSSAIASATQVADGWARGFYTRNPAAETYDQLLAKVQRLMTTEVVEDLAAAGDPTYEALLADRGTSTVVAVQVSAPRPGAAPVDTPTRISRLVTVTINVTGNRPDRITLPQLLTLNSQDGQWVISDVNGGVGP
jgi:hypothetical protein